MEFREKERNSLYIVGGIFLGLFILIWILVKVTGVSVSSFLLPCFLHELTGLYCPGCGGSRAVALLLEGHFVKSFFYHPLVLYGAVLYGWFMISNTAERLSKGRFPIGMYYKDGYMKIAVVILLLNFIIKNAVLLIWGIALMD